MACLRNLGCDVVVIYECDYLNSKRDRSHPTDHSIRQNVINNPALHRALIPRYFSSPKANLKSKFNFSD